MSIIGMYIFVQEIRKNMSSIVKRILLYILLVAMVIIIMCVNGINYYKSNVYVILINVLIIATNAYEYYAFCGIYIYRLPFM